MLCIPEGKEKVALLSRTQKHWRPAQEEIKGLGSILTIQASTIEVPEDEVYLCYEWEQV